MQLQYLFYPKVRISRSEQVKKGLTVLACIKFSCFRAMKYRNSFQSLYTYQKMLLSIFKKWGFFLKMKKKKPTPENLLLLIFAINILIYVLVTKPRIIVKSNTLITF